MKNTRNERLSEHLLNVDEEILANAYQIDTAEKLREYKKTKHADNGKPIYATHHKIRWMPIVAAAACVALVVGLWQGGVFDPATPPVEEPDVTTPTTKDEGGGDGPPCLLHNENYHTVSGNFTQEQFDLFQAWLGEDHDCEDFNIVNFVEVNGITREEFINALGWPTDKLDEIAIWHGNGTLYTWRQFVDAIYGNDKELTEWVFEDENNHPRSKVWPPKEKWPPEGYGFGETRPTTEATTATTTTEPTEPTAIVTEPITPSTTATEWTGPGRDEFGNTTAPTAP